MCLLILALIPVLAHDSFSLCRNIASWQCRLDAIDRKILQALQADGRITNVDLAARGPPLGAAVLPARPRARGARRDPRLPAQVDAEALGLAVTAYVSVSIGGDEFGRVREIEARDPRLPADPRVHSVSGDYDYLLKVVAHDLKSLSTFLTDRLMQVPGIDDVRSMICLEEIKPPSPLPVE